MDSVMYDVVILGGGPAGMATALSLLQHNAALRVAVVERAGYDQPRIGETLPPNAQGLLQQLGVWSSFMEQAHLPAYGTSATWGSAALLSNEFFFSLHGPGWHLDRCAFDAMLAEAAVQRGAELYKHTQVLDCQQQSGQNWQITAQTGDGVPWQLSARFVVDATGRLAWFARQQGAQPVVYDQLTGVAVLLEVDSTRVDTYALVEACELGWWYSALLPAGRLMVMCLSDADLIRQQRLKSPTVWLAQACQTRHTQERLRHARPLGRPATYAARTQCLPQAAGANWLAVGDAASTFDPLSSKGIYKALCSGIFASYAILDWFKGQPAGLERYADLHAREFQQYRATWASYYALEQRWPHAPFWQRRGQTQFVADHRGVFRQAGENDPLLPVNYKLL
jgi:flavin-dependent dehydrogenase